MAFFEDVGTRHVVSLVREVHQEFADNKAQEKIVLLELCDRAPEKMTQTLEDAGDDGRDWHPLLAIFQKDTEHKRHI